MTKTCPQAIFDALQRMYCVFSPSTRRRELLKKLWNHCPTRWENRIESVNKHCASLQQPFAKLCQSAEACKDSKTKSEAKSLIINELKTSNFHLSLVMCSDLLCEQNNAKQRYAIRCCNYSNKRHLFCFLSRIAKMVLLLQLQSR